MDMLIASCVFLPIIASPFAYLICKRSFSAVNIFSRIAALCTLACTAALCVLGGSAKLDGFCMLGISFSCGGFRTVLAFLCSFVFTLSIFASRSYFDNEPHAPRYFAFTLLTFGATMGIFLSSDFFTTFIFFEIMSLSSWVWVAQNETEGSANAARTYLFISIMGGLVMLFGLITLNVILGTLDFARLAEAVASTPDKRGIFTAGICLLIGFGAKAGSFPLHIWLPRAHPVAPAPASALLSGILTKAGIFGIIISATCLLFQNRTYALILLVLGTTTMLLGALLALFSNDLKRTLACSSLSQIGFILIAISLVTLGEDVSLAAGGALLHITNHALIKLVLFVSAGAIYKTFHTLDLNSLRGAGRSSKTLCACFVIGALAISGIPLLGGYISKSLIHEAIAENMHLFSGTMHSILALVEPLFIVAGGLTLAYMTKLIYKLFIQKPIEPSKKAIQLDAGVALAIAVPSVLLIIMGILPNSTYERIAAFAAASMRGEAFAIQYFSLENLKGAALSIIIGVAVFFLFIRLLLTGKNGDYKTIKAPLSIEDNIYKPLLAALSFAGALTARLLYSLTDWIVLLIGLGLKAPKRVKPRADWHFGRYTKQYVQISRISQTLAFELMLFGIGVAVTLVYILVM